MGNETDLAIFQLFDVIRLARPLSCHYCQVDRGTGQPRKFRGIHYVSSLSKKYHKFKYQNLYDCVFWWKHKRRRYENSDLSPLWNYWSWWYHDLGVLSDWSITWPCVGLVLSVRSVADTVNCPVCLWQSNEELGSPLPTGNCHHMLHIDTKHQSKLSNSSERVAQMVNEYRSPRKILTLNVNNILGIPDSRQREIWEI